jgi:hypothetical protein
MLYPLFEEVKSPLLYCEDMEFVPSGLHQKGCLSGLRNKYQKRVLPVHMVEYKTENRNDLVWAHACILGWESISDSIQEEYQY